MDPVNVNVSCRQYLLRGMTTIDSVLIRCVSRLDAAEEEPTLGWATPTLGKVPRYLLPSNFHVVQDLPPSKARIFYAGTCRIPILI